MRSRTIELVVVLVGIGMLVGLGCSGKPPRVEQPSISPGAAASEAMSLYDKNGDGVIGGEELDAVPVFKYEPALKRVDSSGDGKVSEEEIKARIEAWQETKVGVMTYSCKVTYKDRRTGQLVGLEGATVTYKPEPFLGENLKMAEGKTGPGGMASINMPDSDLPGIHLGYYKVEITHGEYTIPDKYNTNTTLGDEVAQDAQAGEELIRVFELEL
jgi:hypothetical protein